MQTESDNSLSLPRLNPEGRLSGLPETQSADTTTRKARTRAGGARNMLPLPPHLPLPAAPSPMTQVAFTGVENAIVGSMV